MVNLNKVYLGDGVYADFDGYHIVLTTEDGVRVTNRICLEDQVFENLVRLAKRIWKQEAEE